MAMLQGLSGGMLGDGEIRGRIDEEDTLQEKAEKFMALCDRPEGDYEPPEALLMGLSGVFTTQMIGSSHLFHSCNCYHLEQIAGVMGLATCCLALRESYEFLREEAPFPEDGQPRPGIAAAQSAVAMARDSQINALVEIFVRTPGIGKALDPGHEGLSAKQSHPKYLLFMDSGPVLLLHRLVHGGTHPALDRLVNHSDFRLVAERLLTFIDRNATDLYAGALVDASKELRTLKVEKPVRQIAGCCVDILHGFCTLTKKGESLVKDTVLNSKVLGSKKREVLLKRMEQQSWVYGGPRCICMGEGENSTQACAGCLGVHYCSRACQKSHWKHHKPLCQQTKPKVRCKSQSSKKSSKQSSSMGAARTSMNALD